jgi:hypothetical protein
MVFMLYMGFFNAENIRRCMCSYTDYLEKYSLLLHPPLPALPVPTQDHKKDFPSLKHRLPACHPLQSLSLSSTCRGAAFSPKDKIHIK